MKKIIIAFVLVMTLVCASAVEADLPEQTSGGSADTNRADSVSEKSDLEILEGFIEHLELLEIKEGKERELKDILEGIKKDLSAAEGSDDKETETKAVPTTAENNAGVVRDPDEGGSGGAKAVFIVLIAVIVAAVLAVVLVPGIRDKVIRGLGEIRTRKNKHNMQNSFPDHYYDHTGSINGYATPNLNSRGPMQSNRIPEPKNDIRRDPGRIAAAFESEPIKAEASTTHDFAPKVNKLQAACDTVLRCYNGEDVDVSDWEWYELDRPEAIKNDDYIRNMADGYSILRYNPVNGSKLFHECVILNGEYLFPNFYSKHMLLPYERNEKFVKKFTETYMNFSFNCYGKNGAEYDFNNFNRPADIRISKVVPAIVKVDEETRVAKIVRPGEIHFY